MQEILEYLFARLKQPFEPVREVGGQPYAVKSDGTLGAPIRDLPPQFDAPTLNVSTLAGFVDAYKANIDGFPEQVAVQIEDYRTVALVALEADSFGRRHVWARARHADEIPFRFDTYYTPEDFLLAFRASFLFNENAVLVQRIASNVSAENSVALADDGMSQSVVLKVGAVTREAIKLPAEGVSLIPWRTFREVNPVESKFLLRMKNVKDGIPTVVLHEIDAKWKLDTIGSITKWIKYELPESTVIA
ncbi:MAG TPA: hypothetical protein VM554_15170 [Acidisarcina sp.]|nr:hypothetical protein [Acidisarcina sp.]